MPLDVLVSLLSAIGSLLLGGVATSTFFRRYIEQLHKKSQESSETFGTRLSKLTQNLSKASKDVDEIMSEIAEIAKQRELSVKKLESDFSILQERERSLKERIESLEKVPMPAVEYFAKLIEAGEKRNAWRDYILFGAGVLVSTIIAIILKLSGVG